MNKDFKKQLRKINKAAKKLNKGLLTDVFKDRFCVHQLKACYIDGIVYAMYEFRDKKCPENNFYSHWVNCYSVKRELYTKINNFIIESDFWKIYLS